MIARLHVVHRAPVEHIEEITRLSRKTIHRILHDHQLKAGHFDPNSIQENIDREKLQEATTTAIKDIAENDKALLTVPYMRKTLCERYGIVATRHQVLTVLRHRMGYVWRAIRKKHDWMDSTRNKYLRQDCARVIIRELLAGKIVANFDEATFSCTTSKKYSWAPKGHKTTRNFARNIGNVHLFLCALSDGTMYYRFQTGTNN